MPNLFDTTFVKRQIPALRRSTTTIDPSLLLLRPRLKVFTTILYAFVTLSSTLLASLYAFITLSVVSSGVRELHEAIDGARRSQFHGCRTVLFANEIHQFSKSQQESFLPVIEDSSIILIGATTENPSFQLTTSLLARCSARPRPPAPQTATYQGFAPQNHLDFDKGLQFTTQCPMSVAQEGIDFLSLHCDVDAVALPQAASCYQGMPFY
ncbi:hypothetical protein ZIOFF_066394 [Zingiber officinale]|uniref:ATPase AAA-type core domain-containing protein n=1 Tax=Zingiber officinale TaxID=94328 RepID=A0A8J5EYF1_ZINOF|nr:hypothetical protein ZIOFF_066394 [Zingiber officinale]